MRRRGSPRGRREAPPTPVAPPLRHARATHACGVVARRRSHRRAGDGDGGSVAPAPAARREPPPSPRGATSPLAARTASPAATIPLGAALHLADVPRRESPREHHRPRRVAAPPHSPANAVGAVRRHRRGPRPAAGSVAPQGARGEGCAPGVVGDVAVRDPDAAQRCEGARRGLPSPRRSEARLPPTHGGDHRHVNTLGASCAFNERGPALERGDLGGRERIEVGPQGGEGAGEGADHGDVGTADAAALQAGGLHEADGFGSGRRPLSAARHAAPPRRRSAEHRGRLLRAGDGAVERVDAATRAAVDDGFGGRVGHAGTIAPTTPARSPVTRRRTPPVQAT